jgi:3-deoxy-D-manno-octulosonic-acid transferase
MNLWWSAYRAAAPLAGAVAPGARWLVPAAERGSWAERLGEVTTPGPVTAWIHAASMGEALAAESLIAELGARDPSAVFRMTATTRGGRTRLQRLDPNASLAPIDSPQAVSRFLAVVRPSRLFLVETELWFHWLLAARAAAIPVAVVSARLSRRSVTRYRWFGSPLARLMNGLAAVLCQSEADAVRWRALGTRGERTVVVGNLKNDALPRPVADRAVARGTLGLDTTRPLLVLGSLRPGEGAFLAEAWQALPAGLRDRWQVTAVPRHPMAAAGIREELARAGQTLVSGGTPRSGAWRWDERLGSLLEWYRAADVAFVGGSLASFGGHNPLEPAACGAAVIMGPHVESQLAAVETLRAGDAIEITTPGESLTHALARLLSNPETLAMRQRAALAVADGARGTARRAVDRLVEWNLWPAR